MSTELHVTHEEFEELSVKAFDMPEADFVEWAVAKFGLQKFTAYNVVIDSKLERSKTVNNAE